MKPYILRRPPISIGSISGAISEWDVYDRETQLRIGHVAQDDDPSRGPGSCRHLWHAWMEADDEAIAIRYLTREEAADDLYREWKASL